MSRILKALEKARRTHELDPAESLRDTAIRRKLQVTSEEGADFQKTIRGSHLASQSLSPEILARNRVISPILNPKGGAIDAYKMLRTKTLRRIVSNQWRVIAVTSTTKGEGKSLTALNLALSISQDPNFEAVLVDADLRSPSLSKMIGFEPKYGLCQYLEGGAVSVDDLLVSPDTPGLGMILNTQPIENSAEALSGSKMRNLMKELRSFSPSVVVIVDMPPLIVDDVLAFAPLVDAMLLVFRAGVTKRSDAMIAREMTSELPVLGCILNGADGGKTSAYY